MPDPIVGKNHFVVNPHDNGGESLTIETRLLHNGDPDGIYYNQKITLNSYGNKASFELHSCCLTPEILRRLANELELAESNWRLRPNGRTFEPRETEDDVPPSPHDFVRKKMAERTVFDRAWPKTTD